MSTYLHVTHHLKMHNGNLKTLANKIEIFLFFILKIDYYNFSVFFKGNKGIIAAEPIKSVLKSFKNILLQ